MSMVTINLRNIEELILRNTILHSKFPEFAGYINQWKLSLQHSSLRAIGKQAIIDLLNHLNERHIEILKSYFHDDVTIDKLSNRIVINIESSVETLQSDLNYLKEMAQVCAYRKGDQVYISFWR